MNLYELLADNLSHVRAAIDRFRCTFCRFEGRFFANFDAAYLQNHFVCLQLMYWFLLTVNMQELDWRLKAPASVEIDSAGTSGFV